MLLEMISIGLLLGFLILFYSLEIRSISNIKKNIRIIIAVTGSRGKSTTVKLLWQLFQKAGYSTLAKITGTKPMLLLPNGDIEKIERNGIVSILEQKRVLLKRAAQIKPDVLITEIMSVTPEYQKVEAGLILTPNYYIITNVKNDHIGVTGENKKGILTVFLKSAPPDSRILAIEDEKQLYKRTGINSSNIQFLNTDDCQEYGQMEKKQPGFLQSVMFAKKLCQDFGISEKIFQRVISDFKFDQEVFFKKKLKENIIVVNAFSANDVDSTKEIYHKTKAEYNNYKKVGIFCTRADKPERTKSWIDSLKKDEWDFDILFVYGTHFLPIKRRQYPFKVKKVDDTLLTDIHQVKEKTIFFGFGNYVGSGEKIVSFWNNMENKI